MTKQNKLLSAAAMAIATLALSAPKATAACAQGNACGLQIAAKGFGLNCTWLRTSGGTFGVPAGDSREALLLSFNKGDTVAIKPFGTIACQGSQATPVVGYISNDPSEQ